MKAWMVLCVKVIIKDYHVPVSQQLKHGHLVVGECDAGVGCTHESCTRQSEEEPAYCSFMSGSVQRWRVGSMHMCVQTHTLKK